jgi:hypothetical protein
VLGHGLPRAVAVAHVRAVSNRAVNQPAPRATGLDGGPSRRTSGHVPAATVANRARERAAARARPCTAAGDVTRTSVLASGA